MILPDEVRSWIIDIVSSNAFQQTAPLVVLILIPSLAFFATRRLGALFTAIMSLGLRTWLPWPFSSSTPTAQSKHAKERKKVKKHVRTRAEQQQQANGTANPEGVCVLRHSHLGLTEALAELADDEGYYAGLVNISGTYCFMNSTLQVSYKSIVRTLAK